ncbi:hypothetical protein FC093_22695 [Ilyomonas limi]|uniref:Uncharacterized protein n=1 Tax=Ilyomonas limi TaxID=2575867 RepID=A0A4U3KQ20_9BACT|nr:hypothetical protein [Ilyomonas limi]TKK64365.1 hypothetical protein FC093_22695 [Ilyomonas limi]
MVVRRFLQYRTSSPTLHNVDKHNSALPLPVNSSISAFQPQQDHHTYLYNTILSNITYYKALAHYRHRRNKFITYSSSSHYKNLRLYYRLTEKGLCLLKTRYALKPKSPV